MTVTKVELPQDRDILQGVAEGLVVKQVDFDAPWNWLAKGWRDLWAIPHASLLYGAVFALTSGLLVLCLVEFNLVSLMLPLSGGFLLIGPLLAVGLYDASRRLETNEEITLKSMIFAGAHATGQIGFMGIALMLVFFAWMEIAFLMFMLFLGANGLPPASEFIPTLLFTGRGLGLLVMGSIVGGVLAVAVFSISAISVPLILVRKIDVVTAALTSMRAVKQNLKAMSLWAVLIAALMLFGLATLFLGLVVVFPLIGHATWHAYRDLVGFADDQ